MAKAKPDPVRFMIPWREVVAPGLMEFAYIFLPHFRNDLLPKTGKTCRRAWGFCTLDAGLDPTLLLWHLLQTTEWWRARDLARRCDKVKSTGDGQRIKALKRSLATCERRRTAIVAELAKLEAWPPAMLLRVPPVGGFGGPPGISPGGYPTPEMAPAPPKMRRTRRTLKRTQALEALGRWLRTRNADVGPRRIAELANAINSATGGTRNLDQADVRRCLKERPLYWRTMEALGFTGR